MKGRLMSKWLDEIKDVEDMTDEELLSEMSAINESEDTRVVYMTVHSHVVYMIVHSHVVKEAKKRGLDKDRPELFI